MLPVLLLLTSAAAFGAPYSGAALSGPPQQTGCGLRYRFTTADPESRVEAFYRGEPERAGAKAYIGGGGPDIPNYRPMLFVRDAHHSMMVILDRKDGVTTGTVVVNSRVGGGC